MFITGRREQRLMLDCSWTGWSFTTGCLAESQRQSLPLRRIRYYVRAASSACRLLLILAGRQDMAHILTASAVDMRVAIFPINLEYMIRKLVKIVLHNSQCSLDVRSVPEQVGESPFV